MEKLPELKRILSVFSRPKKAMEDINSFPTVLVPVMCMIIVPLMAIVVNIGYYRDMLMTTMATMMPPGMNLGTMVQAQLYGTVVGAPFMALLGWLVYALLVLAIAAIFGGEGELSYKKALSLTGYAWLVTVPFTVLQTVLIMANSTWAFTFSLADLVNLFAPTENMFLLTLLPMISLQKIWESIVVIVGLRAIKEVSMLKAAAIVVIIFVLQFAVAYGSLVFGTGIASAAGVM
jgi:hypothetical protein